MNQARVRSRKRVRLNPSRSAEKRPMYARPRVKKTKPQVVSPVGVSIMPQTRLKQRALRPRQDVRTPEEKGVITHDANAVAVSTERQQILDNAALMEWWAETHTHQPKSAMWFMILAAGVTTLTIGLALLGNIIGALTVAFIGGLVYFAAQKEPEQIHYRILADGVAVNSTFYHYRDLDTFNVVYQPGEVKAVIIKSKHLLTPLIHMEIGDADPVEIRELLLNFVTENQDLLEPVVDIWARRLGF